MVVCNAMAATGKRTHAFTHLQVASEARQALHGHIGSTGPRAEVWRRWVPEEEEEEEGASLLRWLLMLLGARWCQQASWHSITAG